MTLELKNMNVKDKKTLQMKGSLHNLYTNNVHYVFNVLRLGSPVLSTDLAFHFTFNNAKIQLSLEKLDIKVKDTYVMKKTVEEIFKGMSSQDSEQVHFNEDYFCQMINGCFHEAVISGKLMIDLVQKWKVPLWSSYNMKLPKFQVEVQVIKDQHKSFMFTMSTMSQSLHLAMFYPSFLNRVFNKPSFNELIVDVNYKDLGHHDKKLTIETNYEKTTFVVDLMPPALSVEFYQNNILHMMYKHSLKMAVDSDTLNFNFSPRITIHPHCPHFYSYFCDMSYHTCINELEGKMSINVEDRKTGTVDVSVELLKDLHEVVLLHVSSKDHKHMAEFSTPFAVPLYKQMMSGHSWYQYLTPSLMSPFNFVLSPFHVKAVLMSDSHHFTMETNVDMVKHKMEVVKKGDVYDMVIESPNGAVGEVVKHDVKDISITDMKVTVPGLKIGGMAMPITTKWTTTSLLNNGVKMEYIDNKGKTQMIETNWNFVNEGTLDVKVDVCPPWLEENWTLMRHFSWDLTHPDYLSLNWTGTMETPVVMETKSKVKMVNTGDMEMEITEKINNKPVTFIFNTKTYTLALEPFFKI